MQQNLVNEILFINFNEHYWKKDITKNISIFSVQNFGIIKSLSFV